MELEDQHTKKQENYEEGGSTVKDVPEWLTIQNLQDLLQIGHTKAYSIVASGEIPGVIRVGRIIRINRQELDSWLERQAQPVIHN
jgi:excisionase family DNA binding protein